MTDIRKLRELLADPENFEDALADRCGTGWDFVREGDMCKAVIEVTNLPSLLDELEELRAGDERLKGLICYLHKQMNFVWDGDAFTIFTSLKDCPEKTEIEQIVGEA